MDYMDYIEELMSRHNVSGYYYKDRSDLIGFHDGGGMVWYHYRDGDRCPARVDRGTPEQEFNRLKDARFNRLRKGT